MNGTNVTRCIDKPCVYGLEVCCYECDYRIRVDCDERCDQQECRAERIRERIYGHKKSAS